MYTLREGCSEPVHGAVTAADRKHPMYSKYLSYRAAMSSQLVACPSFENWLAQQDDDYFDDL